MTPETVLREVEAVFREVLRNPSLGVTRETTADDVEGWDSLTHVELISAVEGRLGIRFTISDVASMDTLGDMVDLAVAKLAR